ncbi:YciE/YciF ferroxidase family protein [Halegenticoccus tardaugens]|uniref:YciE/YciF ferroxidase family protein n=1 Tax=Halegenticoccus tardaugens TaxID=2071624 RepID=UPI00100AB70C|nr:DUF892 family protein [Halegenticoccus tardaugens]
MSVTMEEFFVEGLRKMYYTEQQLVDALEELEGGSTDDEVKQAFSEHRGETQEHVQRLEEAFESVGEDPRAEEDAIVDAMIQEHEEFVGRDPDEDVLERFNIAAGQKSEHYEIAAYGNLIPIADELGHDGVADTLEQNLREEQDALEQLSEIGEEFDRSDDPGV